MPLTPDEEKKLREEIRRKLEEREKRESESKEKVKDEKRRMLEERIRAKIREEEAEKFYMDRGYVKYINRHGEIEWLSAEEAEKRKNRRRSTKKPRHSHQRKQRKSMLINFAMLVVVLAVVGYIYRYNPGKKPPMGSLIVNSEIAGAQIYLDGERTPYFTPDTIKGLKTGKHTLAVYKDGYAVFPPVQVVNIPKNKLATTSFELRNSAVLATVNLQVNTTGYTLYVDGLPFHTNADGTAQVPYGYHTFMVVKKGYIGVPAYRRLLVEPGGTTNLEFVLQPEHEIGYLQISNNYFRGFVYLDKQFTGMQARGGILPVEAGTYEVRVRANGFRCVPDSQLIHVSTGEQKMVLFRLEPAEKLMRISVHSQQPGALLVLDGECTPFVTPIAGVEVSPGPHFLNLLRTEEQHLEFDQPIFLSAQSNRDFYFNF